MKIFGLSFADSLCCRRLVVSEVAGGERAVRDCGCLPSFSVVVRQMTPTNFVLLCLVREGAPCPKPGS